LLRFGQSRKTVFAWSVTAECECGQRAGGNVVNAISSSWTGGNVIVSLRPVQGIGQCLV